MRGVQGLASARAGARPRRRARLALALQGPAHHLLPQQRLEAPVQLLPRGREAGAEVLAAGREARRQAWLLGLRRAQARRQAGAREARRAAHRR
eukprot:CAMPEP_0168432108 /NCGR_PEP_ID=MMETSP0228-20121227/38724_1 /TAXON_ID=133427 /ORGANISM="Protoceratium reticulatum, Strain CCCM 535 (=CCMP 1889)" /LENGTH=93 /DNA_ID=CAMNT_0008446231 /DNA_START=176 /DNA_END=453 /DNA_ORIENTATION=+